MQVIDLGGLHDEISSGEVSIADLVPGLSKGKRYNLDIFIANRFGGRQPTFSLETTMRSIRGEGVATSPPPLPPPPSLQQLPPTGAHHSAAHYFEKNQHCLHSDGCLGMQGTCCAAGVACMLEQI